MKCNFFFIFVLTKLSAALFILLCLSHLLLVAANCVIKCTIIVIFIVIFFLIYIYSLFTNPIYSFHLYIYVIRNELSIIRV